MEIIELKTGKLTIEPVPVLRELIGFASRENNKRGFLFVSKVLGKHIACKPSSMENIHKSLAEMLKKKLNNELSTEFI